MTTQVNDFDGGEEVSRECPNCHSKRIWKDGLRGSIQRYLCRSCGYRFSQSSIKFNVLRQLSELSYASAKLAHPRVGGWDLSVKECFGDFSFSGREDVGSHNTPIVGKALYALHSNSSKRQVCAVLTEAKNLATVEPLKDGLAGATTTDRADIKGKLVEFTWYLKKEGYRECMHVSWKV